MTSPAIYSHLGQYGAKVIIGDGTTAVTPDAGYAFGTIYFVDSGHLHSLTARGWTGDSIANKTFAADARIHGYFTSLTVQSNKTVIAYNIPVKC